MSGRLYVVGTPIGNLSDISERVINTLSSVDFIAAEDTRVSLKLLNHFNIKRQMISYYEHNKSMRTDLIIERILSGEDCAIITDAGMPAISDPGEELVKAAHENGIKVESVPGPSALTTALAISGMPSKRFCFEGFLSAEKREREEQLSELCDEKRTMIFYEAPHKLISTLEDMLSAFGDREIAVVKELTKIHETVLKAKISEALKYYNENSPKGEYVLIVSGKEETNEKLTLSQAVELALALMKNGETASSAAKQAAHSAGVKKNEIYKEIIAAENNREKK